MSKPKQTTGAIEQPVREWPPCDPASVAPLNRAGNPDMYNYMPSRLVPLDEAKARGWAQAFMGDVCRYGHIAPRYVSNPDLCVDCKRIRDGKQPIGSKARHQKFKQLKTDDAPAGAAPAAAPSPVHAPVEPAPREKRFLDALSLNRNFEAAAAAAETTVPLVLSRASFDKTFSDALDKLCSALGIARPAPLPTDFTWTAEARRILLTVYVDTGLLEAARATVGCSASQLWAALDHDAEFRDDFEKAAPLAARVLDEKIVQLGLAGNDRTLLAAARARLPEYRERVQLDVNATASITDEQLDRQLATLLKKHEHRIKSADVIDAEVIEAEPAKLAAPTKDEPPQSGGNSDLI